MRETIYMFDGSFDGLLCAVYEAFARKEQPLSIVSLSEAQLSLLPCAFIESDEGKASRVAAWMTRRISTTALEMVKLAFLSQQEGIYPAVLGFVRLGVKHGPSVMDMLTDSDVNMLYKAARRVSQEAHLYKGFVRFAEYQGGALIAEIEPKSFVLPVIAPHFCDRFYMENFMIYDRTHGAALLHQKGVGASISYSDDIALPQKAEGEERYESLWKGFYNTIGIEGRRNERCRMSHMPKRYWGCMTEFRD